MPKVTTRLTETEIKNAKPQEKAYRLYDTDGLTLLVRPTGTKVWQYRYKFHGKANIYTIGKWPHVGSAKARGKQTELKDLLEQGINPNQKKKADRQTNIQASHHTFEALAREWYAKQTWAPKHAKNIMNRLEKDVFPIIGFKPIHLVTVPDVVAMLQSIEARGALDVARRINQYCTQVFEYAIVKGICEQNPAMGRSRFLKLPKRTNRAHMQESDLSAFLQNMAADPQGNILLHLATELLLLTFVRPDELRHARWSEIDEKGALWSIPAERMKKKREHLVPLSKQALAIIRKIHDISGNRDILFPGQKPHQPFSDVALIKTVKRLTDNKATPHGFRHTASTILNENDFPSDHVEMQLAHVQENRVKGTYNKALYLEQRHTMMQWWADYLDERRPQGQVIQAKFGT